LISRKRQREKRLADAAHKRMKRERKQHNSGRKKEGCGVYTDLLTSPQVERIERESE